MFNHLNERARCAIDRMRGAGIQQLRAFSAAGRKVPPEPPAAPICFLREGRASTVAAPRVTLCSTHAQGAELLPRGPTSVVTRVAY